ncbi:unnamed protein product [Penicillium glandicola]
MQFNATAASETMDEADRQALKHTRTIFLSDGQPHYEDLSPKPELWWVSVQLSVEDRIASDEELMDLVIERFRSREYRVTYYDALHHQETHCVSFPIMNCDPKLDQHSWVLINIGLVDHYQLEIVAGRLAIDRDYIFGPRA